MSIKHRSLSCTLAVWMLGTAAPGLLSKEPEAAPRPPPVVLPAGAREITVEEARRVLQEGKLGGIVDLRTPEEVHASRFLPGARFVNFFAADFDQAILRLKLDPQRPCLLYCALGGRASRAASQLHALGFKEVLVLQGGYEAWRRAGGETSR